MAAGATYEPIATTTLGSAASSITFSSIPSTYTDLRVVLTTNVNARIYAQYNSNTASNYSQTRLNGDGASASSGRNASQTEMDLGLANTAQWSLTTVDIFSYAGSTYKTVLANCSADANGSGQETVTVGLWRSTAALNTVKLFVLSGTMATNTTATIYGIKAA